MNPGSRVGGYLLLAPLGRGGMGQVFRARDERLGRDVALKLVSTLRSDHHTQRALRELEVASRVVHENVVRVHAAGEVPGWVYLVMELVEGESLERALADGPLDPRRAVDVVAGVTRALVALHAAGVLHRDVKPANVLVDGAGAPRLCDFGVARLLDSATLTRTQQLLGTPAYMPPEQLVGDRVDERADVYAVGAILHQALTGHLPADGATLHALLVAKERRPAPPSTLRPGLDPALDRVVLRALAPAPADRYPTAQALLDDLERWTRGEPVLAGAASRAPRAALAALAGVAALVLALALLVARAREAPPATTDAPAQAGAASSAGRPWNPPSWLRALTARGDPGAVRGALDAVTAAGAALDPRAREAALQAARGLDARWRDPGLTHPDLRGRLGHLLDVHRLWQALDPAHRLSAERCALFDSALPAWTAGGKPLVDDRAQVGLALTRLAPGSVTGYLMYAEGLYGDQRLPCDPAVLRAGIAAAQQAGEAEALGRLLQATSDALTARGDAAGVVALAYQIMALGDDAPLQAMHVLVKASYDVAPEAALLFLGHVETREGRTRAGIELGRCAAHHRRHAGGPHGEECRAAAARAFELAAEKPGDIGQLRPAAIQLSDTLRESEDPHGAIAVLDRALALAGDDPGVCGLALRRLRLLRETGAGEEVLRAGCVSLLARLERRIDWLDARGLATAAAAARRLRDHLLAGDTGIELLLDPQVVDALD